MRSTPLCDAYADDWSAFLDRELDAARTARLRAHLEEPCALCKTRVDALRAADRALRTELSADELPGDLRARLQQRIDGSAQRPPAARRALRRAGPLAGLLAAAAAVAFYLAVTRDAALAPDAPAEDRARRAARETPRDIRETLESASEEELALALELDTIEDLDVIENLELLETLLLLEEGTG